MQYARLHVGHSVMGQEIPIYHNNVKQADNIYLLAGVHGDEPEGVFVLNQLFLWLQTQSLPTSIIVIPVVNPDGLSRSMRVNANGVDLNRNWNTSSWSADYSQPRYHPGVIPMSEQENKILEMLFTKHLPRLIISFHSWQRMLDHNHMAREHAEYLAQINNYPLVKDIGYPTPGSLGSYADEHLKCGVITYELPTLKQQVSLQDIWLENADALKKYFLNLSNI